MRLFPFAPATLGGLILLAAVSVAAPDAACAIMPGPQILEELVVAPVTVLAADSAGAKPDSAAAARLARIGDVRQRPRFDQPRWVMLRSLVVPGWGQAHNRSWFKALAVASLEGWMITRIVDDERDLTRLLDDVNRAQQGLDPVAYEIAANAYNTRFNASVSRRWLLGAVIAYAVVDAYVDAHFVDFGVQFDRDPALPGGRKSAGVRLGLRRTW